MSSDCFEETLGTPQNSNLTLPATPGYPVPVPKSMASLRKNVQTNPALVKEKQAEKVVELKTPHNAKSMKILFENDEIEKKKEFDSRNTFCPKTPDIKVSFINLY